MFSAADSYAAPCGSFVICSRSNHAAIISSNFGGTLHVSACGYFPKSLENNQLADIFLFILPIPQLRNSLKPTYNAYSASSSSYLNSKSTFSIHVLLFSRLGSPILFLLRSTRDDIVFRHPSLQKSCLRLVASMLNNVLHSGNAHTRYTVSLVLRNSE